MKEIKLFLKEAETLDTNKNRYTFDDFVEIISTLRSENGCPWDREQTHESLRKNLIEESYEFIHEVDTNSKEGMCEELGDVLLQVLLHAQIAKDEGMFDINDVITGIAKKMINRHPHVFGEEKAQNAEDALKLFIQSKNKEKSLKSKSQAMGHVTEDLPALMKSYKMYSHLEKMQPEVFSGKFSDYINKAREELDKLEKAYSQKDQDNFENELGDVLSTVVSLGHTMKVDSEIALNKNFKKILNRIEKIEEISLKNEKNIENMPSKMFLEYWNNAKSTEN
jgi:tetrapyrrole methylase family protein/MazG family protein